MKKIVLMLLCLFLVSGFVQAGEKDGLRQAGNSSIYFYEVQSRSADSNGHGTLVIDRYNKTFVFNGKEFTPNQNVIIKVETANDFEFIAKGKSTRTGNLHINGSWDGTLPLVGTVGAYYQYYPVSSFHYSNRGWYVAHVKFKWSNDGGVTWHTTSNWSEAVKINEDIDVDIQDIDSSIPVGALVKFKLSVVWGDDVISDETYEYENSHTCYGQYTSFGGGPGSAWLHLELERPLCYVDGYWCVFGTGCTFYY